MTVVSESAGELASYCADPSVEKINANYCPTNADEVVAPVADALPIGWEVRLVFNELLDPNVETLLACADGDHNGACENTGFDDDDELMHGSLVATQPVTLTCGGEAVPYDGYYNPAGNHLTLPAGPALVIRPTFPDMVDLFGDTTGFAATGSGCQVTVNGSVLDKSSNPVSGAGAGPFSFDIAPMAVYDTDPADGAEIATDSLVFVLFNAYVNSDSLATTVSVADSNGVDHPVVTFTDGDVIAVASAAGQWDAGMSYTLTVDTGVQDVKGGTFSGPFTLDFTTIP